MDNTQVKVNKIGSFSTVKSFKDSIPYGQSILKEIFKDDPSGSKIVVYVAATEAGGVYSHLDVYVYDSYTNALEKINSLEYSPNTLVEVVEANVKGYSELLYKCHDGVCYSRLAQVHFQPWDMFKARRLWDVSADVYTVEYLQYV